MTSVQAAESFQVGTWLSLVEHSLGVRGVGSSNLPVPTIQQVTSEILKFTGQLTLASEDRLLLPKLQRFIRERQRRQWAGKFINLECLRRG